LFPEGNFADGSSLAPQDYLPGYADARTLAQFTTVWLLGVLLGGLYAKEIHRVEKIVAANLRTATTGIKPVQVSSRPTLN